MCGLVVYPMVSKDGDQGPWARNPRLGMELRDVYTFVLLNGNGWLELGAKGACNDFSGIHDTFFSVIATLLTCVYLSAY